MSLKYRTSAGTSASNFTDLVVKVGDTLPIGTEVDYDGQTVPAGWQEVDDPNVYSTTETRIGTWIDGKPLYRKVINAGTPSISSGGTISIAHNISNIGILKSVEATLVANNYTNQYPIPYISGSRNTSISNVTTTNVIIQSTSESWSGHTLYIILEYTKTTD
jgi:hypothetical protein